MLYLRIERCLKPALVSHHLSSCTAAMSAARWISCAMLGLSQRRSSGLLLPSSSSPCGTGLNAYQLRLAPTLPPRSNGRRPTMTACQERTFAPEDEVLLLLPASARKMEAVWQGPYPVRRKVDKVNYEIDMGPHRTKRYQVFHINLLRRFRRPQLAAFTVPMAEDDPDTELLLDDCSPLHVDGGHPTINPDLSPDQRQQLDMLLSEFEDTLSLQPGQTTVVAHSIHTGDATPIRSRPYRLADAHHSVVRDAVDEMLDMGVIRASRSPWSSPVVLVPKKDDSIRFCVDYRALNQVAQFNCYPMLRVDEILDSVGSAQFLSTLDLSRGYWQIPLAEDACAKTAFTTAYEFTMMPFGLHGAPATFQRCMDTVLAGLPFVFGRCHLQSDF